MSSRSNNPLCESDNCFNVNELRLSPKDYSPTSVDVSFCFPSSKEHVKDLHNHLDIDSQSPLDKAAHERLERQHLMLREVLGKYPPILEEVMANDPSGQPKACLDLGCGSGGWIMEVARDFPDCNAVAIDRIPMQSISLPPNCRSEVDDLNLGLEHFYGCFNVVHARLLSAGIKDFRNLIEQISQVLRPGGLLLLAEFDFHVYDGHKQQFDADTSTTGPSCWARWMKFASAAMRQRGANTEVSSTMFQWLSEHNLFNHVKHEEYWIPVSPWVQGTDPESIRQRYIGELVRQDITAFVKSGRPMLLSSGLRESLVDELEVNTMRELMDAKLPQYLKMQVVHALKKHSDTK